MTPRLTAAAALSLLVAAPASAQTNNGGIASATLSAMSIADGVGTVTDTLQQTIVYPPIRLAGPSSPIVVFPVPPPVSQSIARTTTDFVATLGGGVSLLTGDHWAFDVDARYVGLLGSRDLHIG